MNNMVKERPMLFSLGLNEVEWKVIDDYDGSYYISFDGKIFSVKSNREIKIVTNNCGYKTAVLSKNQHGKRHLIHRLVAKKFVPNPENLHFVNHKDGNKKNNLYTNLEWCTASQNIRHALETKLLIPRKGFVQSIETREKLSASLKGRVSPCGMKNKHHSTESKLRISASNIGKSRNKGKIAYQYPVDQFNLEGKFIRQWSCGLHASQTLNISHGNLVACLKGKRNKSGGFRWSYSQK